MKTQPNCKKCRFPVYAKAMLYLNHCKHVPYLELIERYEDCIPCLNLYNLSTHFKRRVEQKDILEVEHSKQSANQIDEKFANVY